MRRRFRSDSGSLGWLRQVIDPVEDDALLGDLEELYDLRKKKQGLVKAKIWLMVQLLRSSLSLFSHLLSWRGFMLINYLKIAVRNLLRQWGVAAINVAGLSLGMVLSLLVMLYLHYETHFDTFHTRGNRIYRVLSQLDDGYMGKDLTAITPAPLAPTIQKNLPEVKASAGVKCSGRPD